MQANASRNEGQTVSEQTLTRPEIVHEGRYRLYKKSDGTLRIQYKRDDKETEDFFELPGGMVALAQAASEGKLSPIQMMAEVSKMMMNGGLYPSWYAWPSYRRSR